MRVKRALKRYFIPHQGNDHKPHVLRAPAAAVIAAAVLAVEIVFISHVFVLAPGANLYALIFPKVLVDQTNDRRATEQLQPLAVNQLLEAAARAKVQDMVLKGYFAHTSPEGLTPWYWFGKVGYPFTFAGENLAVNFSDSKDVTDAWMNSPGHRANILNGNFSEVGIATAEGTYQGREATFVVELFGSPAPRQTIPSVAAAAPPRAEPVTRVEAERTTPVSQDLFVAVRGAEVSEPSSAVAAPVAREARAQASPLQAAAASPRATANSIYLAIFAFVLTALLLKVFIKVRIQHPALILNGLWLLALVIIVALVNQELVLSSAAII